MTTLRRIVAIVALLAVGLSRPGHAAGGDEPAVKPAPYKARLIGIPFIYYSPETKLAFGAGSMLNFRAGRFKEATRTSSVWAFASYNLARQFTFLLKPEIYLK